MDMLTIAIAGFAVLAASVALLFAVSAVAVQWHDRRGKEVVLVSDLWMFATVFCGVFLLTAIPGGLHENYGDAAATAVWTVPGALVAGWLACRCIRWLQKRFNPDPGFNADLDDRSILSKLGRSPASIATLPDLRSGGSDGTAGEEPGAFPFAEPRREPIVEVRIEEPQSVVRKQRQKPALDALYFRKSRWVARADAIGIAVAIVFLGFMVGSYAPFMIFPLMGPHYEIGAVAALVVAYLCFPHLRRHLAKAKGEIAVAVDAQGIHVGASEFIQTGSAFIPWAAMKDAAICGNAQDGNRGDIWLELADGYRGSGHVVICKPSDLEDGKGFFDAVCRLAPEGNALRKYFENFFVRLWFLWFVETTLALSLALFAYTYIRFAT